MKNTPYTVLMSVYIKEKAEYLKLSIQSMLDQTVPPDEFILVKDGPLTMELDAVVDYYNQKYPGLFTIISNETNLGLGPALAKGIVTSRNKIVHGHMESLGQFYFKAAKKDGVPVRVAHSHNSATENTFKGKIKGLTKLVASTRLSCVPVSSQVKP